MGVAVASATANAGAQVVAGVVVSRDDALPVVSARVSVVASQRTARSDDAGRFRIAAGANDTLLVQALGFRERRVLAGPGDLRVTLDPVPTVLQAMVTTVGQRSIRISETPASVSVVAKAEIDAAAAVSANQLLRQLPGLVEVPTPPSQTTIAIRGLDAARVLVLVDGEPVSGALIDSRDIGRLSTLAAERIEVVKGPSSVEFGSDALGGVINLVTAAPTENLSVDATMRGGALGRRESTVGLSNTTGRLGYRLNGGWRQMNRVAAANASESTLERVYDFRGGARYRLSERLSFRADAQLSRERQRWPVGGGYNGFIDNQSAQAFTEAQLSTFGGAVRARVFLQGFAYQFRQAQGPVPIAGSADSLEQRERLGRVLIAYSRIAGAHTVDIGAQGSLRSMVAPGKVEGDSANDRVVEVFARDSWQRGPVLVTLGARSTSGSLWGNTFAPSVGAAWQLAPAWRVRGNMARGFRAPSFKEIRYTFLNAAGGYVVEGNPALVPETSWSGSGAVAWAPSDHSLLELEAFRNDLENLIDTRLSGTNPDGYQVYRNVNIARARTEGLEASARFGLGAGELSGGYTFLRARDRDSGAPLDGRAAHTGRGAISYEWSVLKGLATDLSGRYTSEARVSGSERGALFTLDMQLRLRVTSDAELSLGANNLLDRRAPLWTPAYARQVYGGARIRWTQGD